MQPDEQLEAFIASLPKEYAENYFKIVSERLSGGVGDTALSTVLTEKTPVEELSDEELFDDEFNIETTEVEERTTEDPIVEESPLETSEEVTEEPPMRAGVIPEPDVVFGEGRMKRRRI